jgi:hypothetical protein
MRVIEKQMIAAIAAKKPFSGGNTTVSFHLDKDGAWVCVTLHGHTIAMVTDSGKVIVDRETLKEWPTPTTKSRLNALGASVYTRKGVIYLNGVAL